MRSFHGPRWFRALSRLLCVALSAVSLVHCDAVLALAAAPARPQPLPLPRLSPASFLLQAAPLTLTRISTPFNNPIGIDHHSPTNRVVISANYPSGQPSNFELVAADGSRSAFSNIKGLTDEIKIATAKDSLGGFTAGELFTGTGVPGVIARISPDGLSVQNPWVTLPNEFGLMRGSLYVDRTGVFGGDLIAVTTNGGVWRVSSAGVARKLAQIPAHLEGVHTIPNDPARYGPWAGKILAGAEGQGRLYTIDPAGVVAFSALGINPEDIDIIPPGENFYGVDFSGGRLWGAPASAFADMVGDFLIAQEFPGHLWHVRWDGTKFVTRVLATVSQWEHVTFSPAGLVEIPPAGQPPTKTCPPPVTVESTSPAGATVVLSTDVSDPDAGPLQVRWNVDGGPVEAVDTIPTTGKPTTGTSSFSHLYPIGAHQVTLIVSDGVLEARCETTVTVTDNVPPVISCELDTKLLWPPKHEMVDVGLRISASDSSGTPRISIAVFSDEDDEDKTGDGKHSPDAVVLPTAGVGRVPLFLRAEREGDRDGRTYLILITATDPLGNSSFHCCTVIVPDNQSPASVARAEAQAALAEATCTATGSPVTPFKVGDGPVLGPKQTPAPALSFLSVEPANPVLSVGATLALKATGVFADGSVQDLTAEALWTSSAPSVASVDATGRATGVAAGETLVTASARGLSGSTTLTVSTAAAAALIVAPEWARLFTSTSYGYAAFRRLADGTLEDVTTLAAWSSDDASIASVAAGGLVSTVAPGSTRIVATLGGLSGEGAIHVIPRALLTLAVSPSTASIVEGQTRSFSASGFFNDGTTRNVTTEVAWSADPAVASVNASGLALGIDPGTTAVVASRDGVSASGSLTVVARKVVSITLAPPNANLVAGLTLQYTATGSFNDGTTENINASAEWSSGNPAAATVAPGGLATAVAAGAAQIRAARDGVVGVAGLNVLPPQLLTLAVSPPSAEVAAGLTVQFTATGAFTDGSTRDLTATSVWTSDAPGVASVGGGLARGLVPGLARIRAQQGGVLSPLAPLTVLPARITAIEVLPPQAQLPKGLTGQFVARAAYTDGSIKDISATAAWSSSDPAIASVDPGGLARALQPGAVTIRAEQEGVAGTAQLTVLPAALVSIAISPVQPSVAKGLTLPFSLTGTYTDGTTRDHTLDAVWSSSVPGVATIGSSGLAVAVDVGGTLISASYAGGTVSTVLTVTAARIVSIAVTPVNPSLAKGLQLQLTARATFTDGSTADVRATAAWSSSTPLVVAAAAGGAVTALAEGFSDVTATHDGVSGSTRVTVTPAVLTSIVVAPPAATLNIGGTLQYAAQGHYSDGAVADLTATALWTATPAPRASISASGFATALSSGPVTITATHDGVSGTASLSVVPGSPVLLTVAPAPASVPAGLTRAFTATATFADSSTQDVTALATWTSADPSIAFVTAPGLVRGRVQGIVAITATFQGLGGSSLLTVTAPELQSITVAPPGVQMPKGLTFQFTASGLFTDGSTRDLTAEVAWSSANPAVATVSPAGLVTAAGVGTAAISAAKDGKSGSGSVTVLPAALLSLAIAPTNATIQVNQTLQYTLTGTYTDGSTQNLTAQAVWASTTPAVATITPAGLATGKANGGTGITATFQGATVGTGLSVQPLPPPPAVSITSPAADSVITEPTAIQGTSTSDWILEYSPAGSGLFFPFASGGPSGGGTLGTFDPSVLVNGIYTLRLKATDGFGQSTSTTFEAVVDGQVKLGLFTLTFMDLHLPVAGVPVTVFRAYDSRVKTSGDFGIGWSLDVKTMALRRNKKPGEEGWAAVPTGFLGFRLNRVAPRYVTVTFGDGRTETFDFVPGTDIALTPQGPFETPTLRGRPGTTSTLQTLGGDPELFQDQGHLLDFSLAVWDPKDFRLTAKDGTVYVLHLERGLERIRDANGNEVTFSPSGITHSAGMSIPFTRDAANRITRITDPLGRTLEYGYDAAGNLTSSKDREGHTTTYTYDARSNLIDIIDPVGRRATRNEYDASGRLIATIDADNQRIEYAHDPGARQEIVTDRNGNPTVYAYDARGNVLEIVDALGGRTSMTYDAFDNETSRTDPLGRTLTTTYDARKNVTSITQTLGGQAVTTSFTYDGAGRVLSTTDPLNRTATSTYDSRGNLLTFTNPLGQLTQKVYDAGGRHVATVDPLGTRTEFDYDGIGNVLEQRTRGADTLLLRKMTFTYDAAGRQLTATTWARDAGGTWVPYSTMTTVYDANGRAVETRDPLGHSAFTSFSAAGQPLSATDKRGNVSRYVYDSLGQLERVDFPAIQLNGSDVVPSESYGYDAEGRRTSVTGRNGHTTSYEYDRLNRRTKIVHPDGSFRTAAFDAAGQVTAQTDERGFTTRFEYDGLGRRTSITDPLSKTTRFEIDKAGQQTAIVDALGRRTEFSYDLAGRQTRVDLADGAFRLTEYDVLGRRTSETDEAGVVTRFAYLPTGELSEIRQPDPANPANPTTITRFVYDDVGRKTQHVDALGRITRYTYGTRDELLTQVRPMGQSESFSYDAQGNRASRVDALGRTITFQYNALNQLTAKLFPDASSHAFAYFPGGQRASSSLQAPGEPTAVTTFAYDTRNRLLSQTNPDGSTVLWSYDAAGNRTQVETASQIVSYSYTDRNELFQVRRDGALWATYAYDDVGNRSSLDFVNGTRQSLTYNPRNQLLSVQNLSGATPFSSYSYTLDPRGLRTRVVEQSGRSVRYGYDALRRLTREEITDAGQIRSLDYALDLVGNREEKRVTLPGGAVETTTYSYNANDELLAETGPGGITTYAYNLNGETIQKSHASGVVTYGWDFEGRLSAAAGPSETIAFGYDAEGARAAKSVNGSLTRFVVDKNRDYHQVLEERNGASALLRAYTHGDDLISQHFANGATSFYHHDGQLSTRQLSDASGQVSDSYAYDAFGVETPGGGPTPNLYRYGGEQLDPDLGFYYLRARYLNPLTGSFVSRDPAPGTPSDPVSFHRYLYAAADPVNHADPSGEFSVMQVVSAVSIIGTIASIAITSYQTFTSIQALDRMANFMSRLSTTGIDPLSFFTIREMVLRQTFMLISQIASLGASLMQEILGSVSAAAGTVLLLASLFGGDDGADTQFRGAEDDEEFYSDNTAQKAIAILKQNVQNGLNAERLMGITARSGRGSIVSLTRPGKWRVPDRITGTTLQEVKNVNKLRLTGQIKDFMLFSLVTGLKFEINVAARTKIAPIFTELESLGWVKIVRSTVF